MELLITEAEIEEYELERDWEQWQWAQPYVRYRFEVWFIEILADKMKAKENFGHINPYFSRCITFGRGIDNNHAVVYVAQKYIRQFKADIDELRSLISDDARQYSKTRNEFYYLRLELHTLLKKETEEAIERFEKYKRRGSGKITSEFEIKAEDLKAVPIGDIVGDSRGGGRSRIQFKCPIHHEDTPSFVWYVQQNTWWCFGACSKGGDVIDLYMGIHNCDFKTAIKNLQSYV